MKEVAHRQELWQAWNAASEQLRVRARLAKALWGTRRPQKHTQEDMETARALTEHRFPKTDYKIADMQGVNHVSISWGLHLH